MLKRRGGYIGGVCQGLAEATDTNVIAWRLLFIFAPYSIWAYIILWVLLKKEEDFDDTDTIF